MRDVHHLLARAAARALLPLGKRGEPGLEALDCALHSALRQDGGGEAAESRGDIGRGRPRQHDDGDRLERGATDPAPPEHQLEQDAVEPAEDGGDHDIPDDEIAHGLTSGSCRLQTLCQLPLPLHTTGARAVCLQDR